MGIVFDVNPTTPQCAAQLLKVYNALIAKTNTNTSHTVTYGAETLTPGVYSVSAPGSITGTLTLDGQGNPDAVFILKFGGALTIAAASKIVLTNGTISANVFFVVEGVISVGATCTLCGTFVSNNGAIPIGALVSIDGRLFTTAGAITLAATSITVPTTPTEVVDLGLLVEFAVFTTVGAVTNTNVSTIIGHLGTNSASITGFTTSTIVGRQCVPGTLDNMMLSFPATGLPLTQGAKSICFWANVATPSNPATQSFINAVDNGTGQIGYQFGLRDGLVTMWQFGGGVIVAAPSALAALTRTHCAYTFDGVTHKLYTDGGVVASATGLTLQNGAPVDIQIGNNYWNEALNGDVEDVRLYDHALTSNEIQTIFALKGCDHLVLGLSGRWKFNEATTGTIKGALDESSFKRQGTVTGMPTYSSSQLRYSSNRY